MARFLPSHRYLSAWGRARGATFVAFAAMGVLALLSGCRRSAPAGEPDTGGAAPLAIRLQMDWYPQAEHGGFYQALARGLYAEAGLDVTILPGGPGARTPQRVIAGAADIAIYRSDDLLLQVAEGLPFVAVGAFMQHDPQALLLHANNPIDTFAELDGQRIMAMPGTNWIAYLQRTYQISFDTIPMNFGLAQFLADPDFIQQCFITSEPFHARAQGVDVKTLLLADSGYDPYRIMFTTRRFVREHPEAVRRFVAASLQGWAEFIHGDPTPAFQLIAERNPQMSEAQMRYSLATLRERRLVTGHPASDDRLGLLRRARLDAMQQTLLDLGILKAPVPTDEWVHFDALPADLRQSVDSPPEPAEAPVPTPTGL